MRPTVWMSLLIAILGAAVAFIATRTMKADQKNDKGDGKKKEGIAKKDGVPKEGETKKDDTKERYRWPWLGFIAGPGALQLTALLGGMLLASVSGELVWTDEMQPVTGELTEWDADLAKGADVHEISLARAGGISLVVKPEPKNTEAILLLVETGENAGMHRTLKIVGGQTASWRGEPSSSRLLIITKAENANAAPKVHFAVFVSSRDSWRP